jgi:hypothetical protein
LGTFWLTIDQFWPFEEISILVTVAIPARFGLILFSGFRGEDLNVIFYQNMPKYLTR